MVLVFVAAYYEQHRPTINRSKIGINEASTMMMVMVILMVNIHLRFEAVVGTSKLFSFFSCLTISFKFQSSMTTTCFHVCITNDRGNKTTKRMLPMHGNVTRTYSIKTEWKERTAIKQKQALWLRAQVA